MKIIITGGCGFIGSNLCVFLKKKNFQVISIDNLSKPYSFFNEKRLSKNNIRNLRIDISRTPSLSTVKFKADIVIDCCAEPAVEISKSNPRKVFDNNLVTTINILDKVKKDKSKIIFLSSSRIFAIKKSYDLFKNFKKKNKSFLFNEKTEISGPKTIYGFSKIASEFLIEEYSYAYGINYIINRLGVISGQWQFGKVEQGLVSLWMWGHMNKKKLVYKGYGANGSQVRDVLFIDDLNTLIFKQINKFKSVSNQLFCVGGGLNNSFSLKQLTRFCQTITGNKVIINQDKKTSRYDIPFYVTDNKKVSKIYNWKPLVNLNKGLSDMLCWMKKNKNVLKNFF
jgi:CDP-paratose 2-epimerase